MSASPHAGTTRGSGFAWALTLVLALVVVVGIFKRGAWMALAEHRRHLRANPTTNVTADATVALLRSDAQKACDRGAWSECAAKLDVAASFDRPGDATETVQQLRRRIAGGQPGSPPHSSTDTRP
jgi:hypothetical protein